MRRLLLWCFVLCSSSLPGLDYNKYPTELVRTYPAGNGFAELAYSQPNAVWMPATSIAFDPAGNLYIADVYRDRVVITDQSYEIRRDLLEVSGSFVTWLEADELGIIYTSYDEDLARVDWTGTKVASVLFQRPNRNYSPSSTPESDEWKAGQPLPRTAFFVCDLAMAQTRRQGLVFVPRPGSDRVDSVARAQHWSGDRAVVIDELYRAKGYDTDGWGVTRNGMIVTRHYQTYLYWITSRMRQGRSIPRAGNAASLEYDPWRAQEMAWYLGTDFGGNTYWIDNRMTIVFNADGVLLEVFLPEDELRLAAVHPSGDVYGLNLVAKGASLRRVRNVWDPAVRDRWEERLYETSGESVYMTEVTAGPLRVRRAAGLMAEVSGELGKADRVEVLRHGSKPSLVDGIRDYWYEVRRPSDGLRGWVFGAYLAKHS